MSAPDLLPQIRFFLNGQETSATLAAGCLVLDYLRGHARLKGTKEGCREGDCGACTVLIGELQGNRIAYRPVTSCLMPVAELAGKHLVTIEGLNAENPTPPQQAILDTGATQCGFCTPGIVVSLHGLLLNRRNAPPRSETRRALSGHLCRCTGYRSLKASGEGLLGEVGEARSMKDLVAAGCFPSYFLGMPAKLRQLQRKEKKRPGRDTVPMVAISGQERPIAESGEVGRALGGEGAGRDGAGRGPGEPPNAAGWLVAGGTDLYVQCGEKLAESPVRALNMYPEMRGIRRRNGHLCLGALTTFEDLAEDAQFRQMVPDIREYMDLIASWQIRNRATVGGNVVNASPIGDVTILLLALDAELVLGSGDERRRVPLRSFYRGYKKLDKAPEEILTEIEIPIFDQNTRTHFEKVSKRRWLDIATVSSAVRLRLQDDLIAELSLAVGGVAPIPLLLRRTSDFLRGKPVEIEVLRRGLDIAQEEISPISDVRGSAAYKRLLTRQLIAAHFLRLFPQRLSVEELHAAP